MHHFVFDDKFDLCMLCFDIQILILVLTDLTYWATQIMQLGCIVIGLFFVVGAQCPLSHG